jgi:CotH kinase protein
MKLTATLFFALIILSIPSFTQSFSQSTLPIVEINTTGNTIPEDGKIMATMQITFAGPGAVTHVSDEPNIWDGSVKIGVHGASSVGYPQKSYSFTTMMNSVQDSNIVILDMPREHDWLLINNWNDKSFVRNALAQKLFSEMNHYAVRMRHCEVTLNGQYIGIYLLSEKIKVDKGRVDISKLNSTENTGAAASGGYIIKNDGYYDGTNGWPSKFSPVGHPSSDHAFFLYEYPKLSNITAPQKTYIKSFIDSLETALYATTFSDPDIGYAKYMSLNSFIDYFLLNELSRNVDGNKKSSFWHKDRWDKKGKLKAGPVWDFDWAWKNIWDCDQFSNTDGSGWSYKIVDCPADVLSFGWFKRLLQDGHFTSAVDCRWTELRATLFDTESMFHFIDSVELALDVPQQRHFTAFPVLGQHNGAPEVGAQPTTYHGEIVKLKNWIQTRVAWLDANMPGTCDITTSINEDNSMPLSLFPNPNHGTFTILNGEKEMNYELFSAIGSVVKKGELKEGENTFQLNEPKGLYLLRCEGGVMKVVIE